VYKLTTSTESRFSYDTEGGLWPSVHASHAPSSSDDPEVVFFALSWDTGWFRHLLEVSSDLRFHIVGSLSDPSILSIDPK